MKNSKFYMPAEFERQTAVWLGWPQSQWYTGDDPNLDTKFPISDIISTLSDNQITAQIMCNDVQGETVAKIWMEEHGYNITPYMRFVHLNQVDIWMRDYGPIFLRNNSGILSVAGFQQNQWGYSTTNDPVSQKMQAVPKQVADFLGIQHYVAAAAISEGGDRIVNGKGTLLVNRAVEFQRNPQATQASLEGVYKDALGVSNIIWLNDGLREDLQANCGPIPYADSSESVILLYGPQTTGGHLDAFVRFATPNRVVLAQVSTSEAGTNPISAVNYTRLEESYRILSSANDQDGNSFEIVRIPVPDISYKLIEKDQPMYSYLANLHYPASVVPFPKETPAYIVQSGSYANYLETNGLIIAPKYNSSRKDADAADALASAYPGRKIVQINASALNYSGGGIHCVTQQQPVATNP